MDFVSHANYVVSISSRTQFWNFAIVCDNVAEVVLNPLPERQGGDWVEASKALDLGAKFKGHLDSKSR